MNGWHRGGLLLVVGSVVLAALLTWFEFVLTRGSTPPIPGDASIASLESVALGGVRQSVLIRGHDTANPVILFLHGGPGMPVMFLGHAFQRDLERDFVVVHWDRSGAGKSYRAALEDPDLSVSRRLVDTIQLTELLRERFDQKRIYLVGHSWGSYLGLQLVDQRPDLYWAFIGTGQMAGTAAEVREVRLEFLSRVAEETGNEELAIRIADPGYRVSEDDLFRYGAELVSAETFLPVLTTGLFAPEYTLQDALNVKRGVNLVARTLRLDVEPRPLEGEISEFQIPVYFFLGRHDYNTPSELAVEYLRRLEAPLKRAVWFENSAHFPFWEEPNKFHQGMLRLHGDVQSFWSHN